jgi:hypothetical protein
MIPAGGDPARTALEGLAVEAYRAHPEMIRQLLLAEANRS